MTDQSYNPRGRGAIENPTNRFQSIDFTWDEDFDPAERPAPRTQFLRDVSKTIIATNDSPDVGFEASLNPYRGCEHGCVYCYARPTHEYLGFSAGLDFESRIMVKEDAPQLLRAALMKPGWEPKVVVMSGVTDCYQPIERKLRLTRGCLEVFAEFRNPVGIITKNHLVTRDIDIFCELAKYQAIQVNISVTTLDEDLAAKLEPRTSRPHHRLEAIRQLHAAGIPVNVMMAPLIPGLTDTEIPAIAAAVAEAGARSINYVMLRLPHGVKDLFSDWLERHYPEKKSKVLSHVREVRGGELYKSEFGTRMRGEGVYAEHVKAVIALARKRAGLERERSVLSTEHFRRPGAQQMDLFGGTGA